MGRAPRPASAWPSVRCAHELMRALSGNAEQPPHVAQAHAGFGECASGSARRPLRILRNRVSLRTLPRRLEQRPSRQRWQPDFGLQLSRCRHAIRYEQRQCFPHPLLRLPDGAALRMAPGHACDARYPPTRQVDSFSSLCSAGQLNQSCGQNDQCDSGHCRNGGGTERRGTCSDGAPAARIS